MYSNIPYQVTQQAKEWVQLDLYDCFHIQDHKLNILYHEFCHSSDITIDGLRLDYNILATQSSSIVSEITVKCSESVSAYWQHFYWRGPAALHMLTDHTTILETMCMCETALSSRVAINLFTALKDNRLQKLSIECNAITDDAIILEKNSCLVTLNIHNNPLSDRTMVAIV